MKRAALLAVAFGVLATTSVPVLAAGDVTLEGSFVWARDDGDRTGDLKAVFTPTGKNEWTVAFHFDWENKPHVYKGTARGSLSKGTLEGDVDNDNEEHPASFKFSGDFKRGTFNGTHGHINKEGELKDTGTLTLRASN